MERLKKVLTLALIVGFLTGGIAPLAHIHFEFSSDSGHCDDRPTHGEALTYDYDRDHDSTACDLCKKAPSLERSFSSSIVSELRDGEGLPFRFSEVIAVSFLSEVISSRGPPTCA